jgi:hypothetical protein
MFISFLTAVAISNHAKTEVKIIEATKGGNLKAVFAAYRIHKEVCLNENKELKGKKLQECITSKNKE